MQFIVFRLKNSISNNAPPKKTIPRNPKINDTSGIISYLF